MQIENVSEKDAKELMASRLFGKHWMIYKTIKDIKKGQVIKITLDSPTKHLGANIQQYFRPSRGKIKVKTKKADAQGMIWYVLRLN